MFYMNADQTSIDLFPEEDLTWSIDLDILVSLNLNAWYERFKKSVQNGISMHSECGRMQIKLQKK